MWHYIRPGGHRTCLLLICSLVSVAVYIFFNNRRHFRNDLPWLHQAPVREARKQTSGDVCFEYHQISSLYDMMYEYATALGLATAMNSNVIVGEDFPLLDVFTTLSARVLSVPDFTKRCNAAIEVHILPCFRNVEMKNLHCYRDIRITGKHRSYKCFENVDIKKEFVLSHKYDITCGQYINYVKSNLEMVAKKRLELVCLHVDDNLTEDTKAFLPTYIANAFNYFLSKPDSSVRFLYHGFELNWIRNTVPRSYLRNLTSSNLNMIFCIVSYCDHVITTPNAFSWWAGYLNNGTVLYDKDFWQYELEMKDGNDMSEYIPSNWIPV